MSAVQSARAPWARTAEQRATLRRRLRAVRLFVVVLLLSVVLSGVALCASGAVQASSSRPADGARCASVALVTVPGAVLEVCAGGR